MENRKIQDQKTNTEKRVGKNIEDRERKKLTAQHLNARHFLPKNYEIVTTLKRRYKDEYGMGWTQYTVKIKNLSNS